MKTSHAMLKKIETCPIKKKLWALNLNIGVQSIAFSCALS